MLNLYIFHVICISSIAKTNGKTEFPVERIQALDRKIIRHSVKQQLEVKSGGYSEHFMCVDYRYYC